jgi:hypothetical protein
MAIRHFPVVGSPTSAPPLLRKIAIKERFVDPAHAAAPFGLPR